MDEIMINNAMKALTQVLELREGENLLIISDQHTNVVGESFKEAANRIGAKPILFYLPESERPLKDIPENLLSLINESDVALTCFKGFAQETPFRIRLIRALIEVVRRLGHCPGITEEMLREGPMAVDYTQMALSAHALIKRFRDAKQVHITGPSGTDIVLDITDREFSTDTIISDGSWGNLPAGEIWCAPVETSANGVIVCDGSIGDFGQVPSPLRIDVKDGKIISMECDDKEFLKKVDEALSVDEQAKVVGELGIGINPRARITGNLLEDEKAGKTAHIAFGNNEDMSGGMNTSCSHRDFLIKNPTFVVTYKDGKVETVIENGEILSAKTDKKEGELFSFKNVFVAVDFSEASKQAIKIGDNIAKQYGANLHICHVIPRSVEVSPLFPHYVAIPDQATLRKCEEEVVEKIDEMVEEITGRGPDQFFTWVQFGNPASEIVNLAEEKGVDLIVLANRGHSDIARLLIGSVAERVVKHAHCTVMLVR